LALHVGGAKVVADIAVVVPKPDIGIDVDFDAGRACLPTEVVVFALQVRHAVNLNEFEPEERPEILAATDVERLGERLDLLKDVGLDRQERRGETFDFPETPYVCPEFLDLHRLATVMLVLAFEMDMGRALLIPTGVPASWTGAYDVRAVVDQLEEIAR